MEDQHNTHSELRHSFVPSFAPIPQEDRMMTSAGSSVHPTPVHSQYLRQPRQQQQQQQQQQNSLPGTPQHSSAHHSASSSPYHASFPMSRIGTADHASPGPYPHSMPSSRNSSHPVSAPPGAYLDPSTYLNMSDVMGMGIEPLPMGGTIGNNIGMDLSILSAEEHGDIRILERERIRRFQALQDHQISGRRDESKGRGAGRGRKRADSDDSSHDPTPVARGGGANSSNRKQRGRPRLDTKDENAADRRRTQIRLAQRAYRLRKETTISSLRNRVNELETAIDGMQTTFLELHDSTMNCLSKNPEISAAGFGNNLKQLTEKFLGLAKEALGSSEAAESGDEDAEGESINEEENGNARSKRRRSRDDGSPGSSGMQAGGGSVPSFGGYQVSYSRESGSSRGSRSSYDNNGSQSRSAGGGSGGSGKNNTMTTSSSFLSGSQSGEHELYSHSSLEGGYAGGFLQNPSTMFPHHIPHKQEIPTGLDTFSYSFHETNFSRRLHRAGLEYAHLMLSSPNVDQHDVARIFAYTYCYASKEDILKTVSKLLQGDSKASLDINDYPEILQFPRKPLDYADVMRRYDSEKADRGSETTGHIPKDAFDLKEEARKTLIKLGIHQKYLRPDEVEQYITNLGILTTMTTGVSVDDSDLMDIEVEHYSQESPTVAFPTPRNSPIPRIHSPRLPARVSNPNPQGGFTSATVMSLDCFQSSLPENPEHQIDYQVTQFEENHTPPAGVNEIDTESSTKVLEGVNKYVDLDVFIKQLIPRGVCLGRFPGFKKSDVEAAISLATTPVY